MKGTWRDGNHIDVADDATEKDVAQIVTFLNGLRAEREQERKDFAQLWLNASKHIKTRMLPRDLAFEWFRIGYELAESRKSTASPVENVSDVS